MADSRIDPRAEALGVFIKDTPLAHFRVTKVEFQNEEEAQGQHNIWWHVYDEVGHPLPSIKCYMDWVGRVPKEDPPSMAESDGGGNANIPMYANLDVHLKNGPYIAEVNSTVVKGVVTNLDSDTVNGMGLPEHHHVNFIVTFQRGGPTPPPPPPPPPTGSWVIVSQDSNDIVLHRD